MIDLFNNAWFIGISGGIISGLLVYFITSKIISRKENKEYQQKIKLANIEILYGIRPLVVEEMLPTHQILESILFSTALKYGVKVTDLYNKENIASDLTKEILDNPFLTSQNKLKYCDVTEKIKYLGKVEVINESTKSEIISLEDQKSNSIWSSSLMVSLVTSILVALGIFFFKTSPQKDSGMLSNAEIELSIISIILLMLLLVAGITLVFFVSYRSRSKSYIDKLEKELSQKGIELPKYDS